MDLQVIHAVAIEGRRLQAKEGTPRGYLDLLNTCMAPDPDARPTFEVLKGVIKGLRTEIDAKMAPADSLSPAGSGALEG